MRGRGRLARGSPLAVVVAGLSLALADCGVGAPSASVAHLGSTTTAPPASSSGSSSGSEGGQVEKFVSCMRHHGVPNFPDLVMSPNGGAVPVRPVPIDKNSPTVQAARADCQSVLPAGPAPPPPVTAKDQADYLKAAACMRAHGVPDFPDPKFSGTNVTFPMPPGMNASIGNSPTFLRPGISASCSSRPGSRTPSRPKAANEGSAAAGPWSRSRVVNWSSVTSSYQLATRLDITVVV